MVLSTLMPPCRQASPAMLTLLVLRGLRVSRDELTWRMLGAWSEDH